MRITHRLVAAASLAALFAAPGLAQAQTGGFALDRFEPAPVGDTFFGVPGPGPAGHLIPRGMVMFDYANRPVRLLSDSGSTSVVSGQGFLRADVSFALWNHLALSVDVPFAVLQGGQDPGLPGVSFPPPGTAIGDIRIGLAARLFGHERDPFQIGIGGYVFAPTGKASDYTGDGAVRGSFHASVSGRIGQDIGFLWGASGGATVHAAAGDPSVINFGAGIALALLDDHLQIGPELYGGKPLGNQITLATVGQTVAVQADTNMEAIVGAKVRILDGLVFGAALGPGLLKAVGTPNFRAIGMLAWSPPAEHAKKVVRAVVGDRDDDGIPDDTDACPDVKGEPSTDPKKDGCPPSDRDGDGISDVDDACPTTPGTKNADKKRNGCPSDRDGDGVLDAVDACPDVPGPPNKDPKWNGCPEDPDGDGIKGDADACPNEKGLPSSNPRENGCPRFIHMDQDEITTHEKIEFRVDGKTKVTTIEPVSNDLLGEVRDAILQHPDILKVEVQGHTDDSGGDAYNMKLSQDRAEAVRQWLIDAGVPAEKLVAKGYGYERPLADNRIRQGRQINRRVQFIIIERKPK